MIADLARDELTDIPAADVCIIGAGVAGQTVALRLAEAGRRVLMVESGDRDFRSDVQALSDGDNVGEDYYPLDTARLRLFGGTAAIWGGRCAELDPIDFEKRGFVPHSGWPITKAVLDPHYDRAYAQMGLERAGEGRLWRKIDRTPPPFDPDKLDSDLWCFDENGERFTDPKRGALDKVDILLNATLTEMDVSESGEVRYMTVKSLTGKSLKLEAKTFVLAAGAIETVRLLFATVPTRPAGFGNGRDLVGRYFMEHPHARGGEVLPEKLSQALMLLPRAIRRDGKRYAAYLRPSEKLQREAGILNSSLSLAPRRHADDKMDLFRATKGKLKHDLPSTRFWRSTYKSLKTLAIRGRELTDPWPTVMSMKKSRGRQGLYAILRAEQAPIAESRVGLSDRTDALGVPLAELDWHYSELDKRSVKVLMETLKSEIQRLGVGDVRLESWLMDDDILWTSDPLISAHPIGGYHHMGGVRMGADASTGVVDKDCKLFESPNLYVAGSAVFPTGGWANPTVTIMALADRLGAHLDSVL